MLPLDHAYQNSITHGYAMYNLLGYSSNYSMTSGKLWNYYKDELIDVVNENNENGNYRVK